MKLGGQRRKWRSTKGRRPEYAVPNAETRHGSTSGNCQARLRNAPKPKPKTFWCKNSRDTSTTFPARKMCRLQLEKSTERAAREGKFGDCAMQPLLECTRGHVTRRSGLAPERARKRDGQPARARGRCLVTMPSRLVRARGVRSQIEPSGSCGRGGAN